MATLVAVDPGDRWTGVAFFTNDPDPFTREPLGWRCQGAVEMGREEFEDSLSETLEDSDLDFLVYERFRLYGDKAGAQTGSEFDTSQIIGVIKWLVRTHNAHAAEHEAADKTGHVILPCEAPGGAHHEPRVWRPTTLAGQMADIKKPTRGILNHRGIKSVARPIAVKQYEGRDHIMDAELHGWHYILNRLEA